MVGGAGESAAAESLSGCEASALVGLADAVVTALRAAGGRGEAVPLARAAASAACSSFFLRLSSAPKLELRGRREEGGERLACLLLCELLPSPAEEACRLLREREEERREEEYCRGERLLERPERRETGLVLEDLLPPYGLMDRLLEYGLVSLSKLEDRCLLP